MLFCIAYGWTGSGVMITQWPYKHVCVCVFVCVRRRAFAAPSAMRTGAGPQRILGKSSRLCPFMGYLIPTPQL